MNKASRQPARVNALMYHGISEHADRGSPCGRSYTVSLQAFDDHLNAFRRDVGAAPSTGLDSWAAIPRWAITFDDGAESALRAADLLDSLGWRAYFFVVSSWMGNRGFLEPSQIVILRERGHVVGSHSFSHPDPMSGLSYADMVEEWQKSLSGLAQVLGEPVTTAAVPGGGYSSKVAAAAAEAGVELLFTSEPVSTVRSVQGCTVIGRYVVRSSTDAGTAAALAAGERGACTRQWLEWNCRKIPKKLLGSSYYSIRARMLSASSASRR